MNYPAPFKNFLETCERKNLQVELGHELKSYESTYLEIFISVPGATLAGIVQLYTCGFDLLFPLNDTNNFNMDISDIETRLNAMKEEE